MNIVCTICSDLVNQAENIYVTLCGHVFHYHCLAQWIERSKTCPHCRNEVTKFCIFRVYPTVTEDNSTPNAATLQSQLDNVKLELQQQKLKVKDDTIAGYIDILAKHEDIINTYQKKLACNDSQLRALQDQLAYTDIQLKETQKLKEENESLKKNMQTLNGALCESEAMKNNCRDSLHMAKQQLALKTKSEKELQNKVIQLEEEIEDSKATIQLLEERLKSPKKKPDSHSYKQTEETQVKYGYIGI